MPLERCRGLSFVLVALLPSTTSSVLLLRGSANSTGIGCGPLKVFPNAKPKNFADSQPSSFDPVTKKQVAVTFGPNDVIDFECLPGFTTDGAKDGSTTFQVQCSEMGYFKPGGVCLEASKCGAVPTIPHALPTGELKGTKVEFSCAEGYSLDGEKVVVGGFRANQLFTLECIEFKGTYEMFTGECKPYTFAPAGETARLYNRLSEALFVISCKSTLKKEFGDGRGPGVDDVCGNFKDGAVKGDCQTLVTQIEADFESEQASRKAFDENDSKDWYEEKGEGRPGINEEADVFCKGLWGLLALAPPR